MKTKQTLENIAAVLLFILGGLAFWGVIWAALWLGYALGFQM